MAASWLRTSWDFIELSIESFLKIWVPPYRSHDVFKQLSFVAWESAPVVVLSVSFAAVVTILESAFHMKLVIQNDSLVPGFAALLILRELGAVVTALLVTSRVGAGLAAEVGSMKITDQMDALKMLSIDPVKYLVVPRLLACMLGGIILTCVANFVCLFCAMAVSQISLGYSWNSFLTAARGFVDFRDFILAMVKGCFFGSVIPLFSCFFGFRCKSGAEGVGLATTNSVVTTSIAIIILDFVLGYIFSFFY
ncbi:MAG: ABC transporter permease [Bdellovibrionales bacterium]|nr:ABC transporter permease [Bdellovibrionales bacterium]